jgi:hypothetical protein
MNTPTENLTTEEQLFFEAMSKANEDQIVAFRAALNVLMTCFGSEPKGALLALHVMRDEGSMTLHAFNLMGAEPQNMLMAALATMQMQAQQIPEPGEMH